MIKETIKYMDFNGVEREEEHYFHLSEAEITEMELSVNGGLTTMIERIVKTEDTPSIAKIFKELILKSYGIKSIDGRRFMKEKPEGGTYADEFKETGAYPVLYMKLATDSEAAARFVNGIIPADVAKKLAEQNK